MISTPSSAAEAALENQRIGGLQIRVAALCTLVQMCDGFDINSIAWAVPSLIRVWHLPPPAFTTAFLWSSIGISDKGHQRGAGFWHGAGRLPRD